MKKILLVFLLASWAVMVYKTIQVSAAQSDGFLGYYFGEMFANTWQSHFNVDLLVHSLLFSFWVVYREKHMVVALLCGICAIAFGAVFSFLYLLVLAFIYKGNVPLMINGRHNI
ncbi:MAG: hypothetical protein ACJASL_002890 [Paraglaciecola sp.]|jgi:hypothetical protein